MAGTLTALLGRSLARAAFTAALLLAASSCRASPRWEGMPRVPGTTLEGSDRTFRVRHRSDGSALEASVRTFARDGGPRIVLVSLLHVADPRYYEAVVASVSDCEAVYFEGFRMPSGSRLAASLAELYGTLARMSDLVPQSKSAAAPERLAELPGWTNVDASEEDLPEVAYLVEHRLRRAVIQVSAAEAMLGDHDEAVPIVREALARSAVESGAGPFLSLALRWARDEGEIASMRDLASVPPDSALRAALPRTAARVEDLLARPLWGDAGRVRPIAVLRALRNHHPKGEPNAEAREAAAVILARNDVLLRRLEADLTGDAPIGSLGLLYGGAHGVDIVAFLVDRGYALRDVRWLSVCELPPAD